jgi:DMSO/TMAO reductase YedYZ molybdopterin-dependent catalytic subunit
LLIRKNGLGKLFVCLMLSLFLGLGSFMMPAAASAADISVTVTGDGVESPVTFTLQDLQCFEQVGPRLYSSINTWPSKKWYMGEGPRLIDILEVAGIKDDAKVITVKSTDSYKMTFTRKELLEDPRYYFPGLMETGGGDGGGHLPGSPDGAEPVDAIIALKSIDSDQAEYMNDLNAPLLLFGQRWVTEQTNHAFAKYVSEIEVSTATPGKWAVPTSSHPSGTYPVGTQIRLESEYNDADKVYYTTDNTNPTVKSPMYNWIASRWWGSRQDDLDIVNHPIEINSDTTIKAVTIGLGKEDSDIVTFEYTVGEALVPAPSLTADATNNTVGSSIELTFAENEDWANAIAEVLVNDTVLTSDQYSVDPGQLIIDASALDTEGEYTITVKATGYQDAVVTQLIKGIPVFTIEGNAVEEVAYTMAELQAMDPTTDTYTSKNGDISCTGVTMADLLTALDITDNSLQVQINTTDAATYPVDPVTVVDMLNTENRYLLTYEIDGEPITGDDTALRMYWSGKVIKNVTGITVTEPATEPTTYTVTFTVTPPDAAVVVKDIEGNIVAAEEDGTYNLDTGEYNYTVSAEGYVEKTGNFTVIGEAQTVKVVLEEVVVDPDEPRYNLIPAIDTVYSIGETADGIKTMTVNSNQSGFKYFTVSIEPVVEHEGTEVVVFTHLRDKAQLQLNATEADFDIVNAAKAGFNVNPGDVIKAYVVDQLTNETTSNPLVMQ